jgi:hypothetical protein
MLIAKKFKLHPPHSPQQHKNNETTRAMALSKNESDIILNRANVALARSQRLVASWLPERTPDELANAKSEEELQREEDEIFTAVPET